MLVVEIEEEKFRLIGLWMQATGIAFLTALGIIMAVFLAQWYADSRREAAREDRRLDREERLAAQRAAAGSGPSTGYDDATGGREAATPDEEDR